MSRKTFLLAIDFDEEASDRPYGELEESIAEVVEKLGHRYERFAYAGAPDPYSFDDPDNFQLEEGEEIL